MTDTSLCYIYRNDEVLMLHRIRKKNDVNRGKWIGLGGKFEPGEGPEDCVRREVLEETGLELTSWQYRGIVTFESDQAETERMHLFTADGFRGEMIPCDEGELSWIPRERLFDLPMWEGDPLFLKLLEEGRPFFRMRLVYRGDRLVLAEADGERIR